MRELRDEFGYRPFRILLFVGVGLRILVMLCYFPAVMLLSDSPRYARINHMPLYGDFWMPAGYPMFLKVVYVFYHQLWFTIAVQHLVGLVIGILLFLCARRIGISQALSCIPTAVPLLSGDHLYLEHQIMTDHLFASLAVAGLCAAVFGLVPRVSAGLLAAASALLAMAALVRSVGVVLLPILAFCTALWMKGSLAARTRAIAIALVPGTGVFGLYIAGFYLSGGPYLGFVDMSGWNLYSRVAPFADCSRFIPPEGTAVLCEQRAPVNRPGPFGYVWDLNSTPRKEFQLGPETAKKLGQFAKEALVHQPLDYLQAVGLDLIRYIDPATAFKRAYAGQSTDMFSFRWRDQAVERQASKVMAQVYRGTKVSVHGEWLFAVYQNVFRVTGLFVCAALVLSVGGLIKAKWPVSLGIVLFGTSAIALYLIPVLTLSYHFRYGVPPETLLVFAGVLGAASIWPRLQAQAGQL